MSGSSPTHLISLADGEGNSVTVSILGRNAPWTAGLDAEKLVPPDDWIADHHRLLRRVMDHWVPMLAG
ncbi:hypothetical protein [Streptomyces cyaneofuscatus]|uniref:hypothetical protein n=1 Tax=Streptomyces cyaneofuscatus TaxID=66883 RepID=UPI003325AEFB